MPARPVLLLSALAALLGAGARADTPPAPAAPAAAAPVASETMAGHRLKNIIEHQRILFADAAAQGKDLDEADFKNQVEQLTREYESLLRDSPEFAEGYADYGYMLWKVGLRKQAVAILLKANQLNPDIALVKNELGNYLAEDGKPLEALNYFLAAVKIEPAEPLYHYQLGTLLYEARDDFLKSGEWSRAAIDHSMMEAFRTAAELAPDRIEFTYRYAESFADMVDPDWAAALKAWESLEGKAKSDIERQTMRLQEANILLNMGKRDRAAGVLEGVTEAALEEQKQKLAARLGSGADK
jgi:tetratricopeptide (TPR) repeat protein